MGTFWKRLLGVAAVVAMSSGAAFADPPFMPCCRNPGNPNMGCCEHGQAMACCAVHPNGPKVPNGLVA